MTTQTRREKFDANIPALPDEEIDAAFAAGRMVDSFRADPVVLEGNEVAFIALKVAFANGNAETVLLDQFSARVLHRMIELANQMEWRADGPQPAGVPR